MSLTAITLFVVLRTASANPVDFLRQKRNCPIGMPKPFSCSNRRAGLYADVVRECAVYYECNATNDSQPIIRNCLETAGFPNVFFDDSLQRCVAEIPKSSICGLPLPADGFETTATAECRGMINAITVLPDLSTRCRQYTLCVSYKGRIVGLSQECPKGSRIDIVSGACTAWDLAKCPCVDICPIGRVCS